jgi:hypothetical protein
MNRFGILLDEFPLLTSFILPLIASVVSPLASALFADVGGRSLDVVKAFTVLYDPSGDSSLSSHFGPTPPPPRLRKKMTQR